MTDRLDDDEPAPAGEQAVSRGRIRSRILAAPGLATLFLLAVLAVTAVAFGSSPLGLTVVAAAVVGGYMALNVGANDVANNMGPAVGGKAVSMGGALVIAAICEAAGALIAGGDVVETVSKSIITPDASMQAIDFILLMLAALLAAAMWIHLATFVGAPVSTTHSVVGGIIGAGIAASGTGVVSWPTMGGIAASWVVSPLLGAVIAAGLLGFVKWAILFRDDPVSAARRWVPMLIGLMCGVFALYLLLKGLKQVWAPPPGLVWLLGVAALAGGWALARPWVRRQAHEMDNRRSHISGLFTVPLVFAAGLLSFAHGANDVANAVGPLAAIVAAASTGVAAPTDVVLPLWILLIGATGIALGLALFGPRLIRTVGEQITKLDPMRAYCVALSAAVTVLIASALGLPVSSTHIAIGGVFGVGYLRERIYNRGIPNPAVQPRTRFLKVSALNQTPEDAVARFQSREKRRLVRRRHVLGIGAAWVVTVPAAGLLAALLYLAMSAAFGS